MLHRIIGRAGSGKSTVCYDVISDCIKTQKKVFFIVPEQQAVLSEREIIRRFGNESNLYVEVINFKRLCNRVFREVGGLVYNNIDSAGKKLILAKTLDTIAPNLTEYAASADNPEFIQKAFSTINELTSCNVAPKQLVKVSQELGVSSEETIFSKKLQDLSLIYSSYRAILQEDYNDKGDLLDNLYEALKQHPFFKNKTVLIDSFYGFTAQEFKIIGKILQQAEDTYVSFLCSVKEENDLFLRSQHAKETIGTLAKESGIDCEDILLSENKKLRAGSGLMRLEEQFSIANIAKEGEDETPFDDVTILHCESAFEEAKCASSVISRLVSEEHIRYRNIAVCMRDPSSYEGIIDVTLEKDGIPYHFSRREELISNPIVSLILSAFDICSSFHLPNVRRFLKTGLSGLTDEEADLLENYAVTWSISGSRWHYDEWFMNPDGYSEEFTERGKYILSVVNRAKAKLCATLETFTENIKDSKDVKEMSKAVFRLLCDVKSTHEAEIASSENAVFWNLVLDALDRMVFVFGDSTISYQKYAELFKLMIEEFDTGKIPGSIDEVQIASCELMRTDNVTHILILGVNDGIFPAEIAQDNIFSDKEKKLLRENGISLSPDSVERIYDELFLAYSSLCAAKEKAYILYHEKDHTGGEKRPSILVSMIKNILPGCEQTAYPFKNGLDSLSGKLSAVESTVTETNPELKTALEQYFALDNTYSPLLEKLKRSERKTDRLGDAGLQLVTKSKLYTSSSRLEQFNKCAFSYFGNYILGIKVQRQAELGAVETGNIAHKVLEIFMLEVANRKTKNQPLFTKEEAKQAIKTILEEYITSVTGNQRNENKRFSYLYTRLSGMLCALAESLIEEISQSEFFPSDFELEVSNNAPGGIPPFPIPIEDHGVKIGEVSVVGKIDRVDTYEKDGKTFVRVVDYKTGPKKFNKDDVITGINLQMLLYLFQIWKNGKDHYHSNEIIPSGVLYLPCQRPEVSISLGDDEETTLSDLSGSFSTNGIVLDDIEILRAMEKDLQGKFIPVGIKKDGSLTVRSSVASTAELGDLLNKTALVAAKLAREMTKGSIKVNPYKCELNSCSYCDLLTICGYEKGKSEARYRMEEVE